MSKGDVCHVELHSLLGWPATSRLMHQQGDTSVAELKLGKGIGQHGCLVHSTLMGASVEATVSGTREYMTWQLSARMLLSLTKSRGH